MESDLGHRIDDLLAVQLNHNPQDTVCTRMLRSEVQKDEVASVTAALHAPLFGAEPQQLLFLVLLLFGKVKGPHLSGARGMVFSQRMPYPASRHQYALQVGVPGKRYSEHIPYFAFVPIRRRPKARDAVERQGASVKSNFHPDVFIALEGEQVIDDRERGGRQALPVHPHPVVDRGQVVEHCVRSIDLTLEISQDFSHTLARSPKRRYPVAGKLWSHIAAILLLQRLDRIGGCRDAHTRS